MSAQPVTTLETIEHLDFKSETPCEHSLHAHAAAHPADLLIRFTCTHCPRSALLGICFDIWHEAGRRDMFCRQCGVVVTRDSGWKVLEVLS